MPGLLGLILIVGAFQEEFGQTLRFLSLGAGLGAFTAGYLCGRHASSGLFVQITFLFPRLGGGLYRIEKEGVPEAQQLEQLKTWSVSRRLCQHPATASLLLEKGEHSLLEKLVEQGAPRFARQALPQLLREHPHRAHRIIEDLSVERISEMGEETIQMMLAEGPPELRQKALRASRNLSG